MTAFEKVGKILMAACIAAVAALFASRLWLDSPFLSLALAGSFVLHMWERPSWPEVLATVATAGVLVLAHVHVLGARDLAVEWWMAPGHFLGWASFVVLGVTILWREGMERRKRIATFEAAAGLPLFAFFAAVALTLTARLHPAAYDPALYAFDATFGFQPSFVIGRLFVRMAWLREISRAVYGALPLAVAIVYASERSAAAHKKRPNLLLVFAWAGLAGFALYHVVPAAGPIYVYPAAFPWNPPAAPLSSEPMALGTGIPRNAMPSLHVAWALLLVWNSRLSRRWIRALCVVVLGFTVLATLGLGEHYLIDLIVAVPFALAVQAACATAIPARWPARLHPLLAGSSLTSVWLGFLRVGAPVFPKAVILSWLLAIVTVLYSLLLKQNLDRAVQGAAKAVPEIVEPEAVVSYPEELWAPESNGKFQDDNAAQGAMRLQAATATGRGQSGEPPAARRVEGEGMCAQWPRPHRDPVH